VPPVLSDRADNRLKLARAFGSLGSKSLFGSLGRLLRMLDGPLLAILLHPSLVYSGPLGAGGLLGLFCTFGRLLRVPRPLFAHDASFSPLKGCVLLVVSVTGGAAPGMRPVLATAMKNSAITPTAMAAAPNRLTPRK